MARKQPDLGGIFKSTTPETGQEPGTGPAPVRANPQAIPATGRTVPVGVGLKESEIELLDAIAGALGVKRNQIMRYAVRQFLADYAAGNVAPEVEEHTAHRLKM